MKSNELVAKELMGLERQYWNAIKNKDAKTAASLSGDPCVVVGAQGIGEFDKKTLTKMLQTAGYELNTFSFDDVHVRHVREDVVAVAYKVKEQLTVEGKPVELEAFDASVWMKRNGEWECVIHTESLAGDPFGRH